MRSLVLGILALAAALAGWCWWSTGEALQAPDAPPARTGPAPARRQAAAELPAAAQPATALQVIEAALPPATVPLAQAREAWWQAARAGSGEAAWRLLQAMETCAQRELARGALADETRGDDARAQARILALEEYLALAEHYCADAGSVTAAEQREALWLGVRAGDVRAMTQYLLAPPIPREQAIAHAEELLRYRQSAPGIAQALLEGGHGEIAAHLALAHDGLSDVDLRYSPAAPPTRPQRASVAAPPPLRVQAPLGQVLPDDPALAWRYARLCLRVADAMHRPRCEDIARANGAVLTDTQRELLQAWVDRWRERPLDRPLPFYRAAFTWSS